MSASRYHLVKELESHNGARACGGKEAERVLEHLKVNAYVRPESDRLVCYRGESKDGFITFTRAGRNKVPRVRAQAHECWFGAVMAAAFAI